MRARLQKVRDQFKQLIVEYGPVAVLTYFTIFGTVIGGAALAIKYGFKPESTAGEATVWGAAYLFARALLIPRLAATAALTPIVARGLARLGLFKLPTRPPEPDK